MGANVRDMTRVHAFADDALDDLDAVGLVAAMHDGLSVADVIDAAIARAGAVDAALGAMAHAAFDRARNEARTPRAGFFAGVPTFLKDNVDVEGMPTQHGTDAYVAKTRKHDGDFARMFLATGVIPLGKTRLSEFGLNAAVDHARLGPVRSPWHLDHYAGASSAGSAAFVAAGVVPIAHANDGGGSIRIPASFCGLFGIKPTWGIVPVYPHSPAWTLWHQGPISRTVSDAASMLTLIAQPDVRDWAAAPALGTDYRQDLDKGVKGLRIGYSPTLGYAKVDSEVATLVKRAVNEFTQFGAHVEELDLNLEDPIAIMQPMWAVALALAVAPMSAAQRVLCDPGMLELAEPGFKLSALEYRQLERARDAFGRRMTALYDQYDLLITPQLAITAFAAGHEVPPDSDMKRWWQWSPFTYPFNLTQQPAATVPCGFAANGLPVAMQIVGAKFADALVLRAARAYEIAHPFVLPRIPKAD